MEEALLDTDIISELMVGKDEFLVQNARQYYRVFRRYTVSVMTVSEILSGHTQKPRRQDLLNYDRIQPPLEMLSIDRTEAETAGRILGALKARGQTLERSDPFIAATAIENDLLLITGNTRHYERIVSLGYPLRLSNWRAKSEQ